jgi:hypothetical protein
LPPAQHLHNFAVCFGNALLGIHKQQNDIRRFHRDFGLGADIRDKGSRANGKRFLAALSGGVYSARIHDKEIVPGPIAFGDQTVARGAGYVINNREALANQAVE